ncbi:spore germination lipoprotein GerD [Virgibacillus halophilus]|uniref:Spore germination lipoprotein GerD n=1 Tax=Tigheibacillus halophilus TaxID=361280 RepID=A0ABU5C6X0_9BACI|nr:spore germination lipoprotein GerD [Virgibacillus halophilus]
MLKKVWTCGLALIFAGTLSACSGTNSAAKEADYDTTKKMVVDILQTDEGKKAVTELVADEKMKKHLVMDSDTVKNAINNAMSSEQSKKVWEQLFEDPQFVANYAKSMDKPMKQMMKDLMKDPDFQKRMLELLQNPEMNKEMLQVMKSQKFRSHLKETVQETLESPLFQEKIQKKFT